MTVRTFFLRGAATALAVLLVGACDSTGPDGPEGPGFFDVTLVSPNGDEGSAVFELTGGTGLGVVSAAGAEVFHRHFGGSTRVVIVLDEPGQIRFQVRTADVGQLPEGTVIQVADDENELRESVSAYSVQVSWEEDSSGSGQGA